MGKNNNNNLIIQWFDMKWSPFWIFDFTLLMESKLSISRMLIFSMLHSIIVYKFNIWLGDPSLLQLHFQLLPNWIVVENNSYSCSILFLLEVLHTSKLYSFVHIIQIKQSRRAYLKLYIKKKLQKEHWYYWKWIFKIQTLSV